MYSLCLFFAVISLVESVSNHSVQMNPQLTAFRAVGALTDAVSHSHLVLTFNLTQEREVVKQLRAQIVQVTRNTTTTLWSPTLHRIGPLEDNWDSFLRVLHTPAAHREKRQAIVVAGLAAGAVVASVGLSVWNVHETKELQRRMDAADVEMDKLFTLVHSSVKLERKMIDNVSHLKMAVRDIENSIGELTQFMEVSEAAHALFHRLQRRLRGLERVLTHRLDPELLSESELGRSFELLSARITEAGYKLVFNNVNQLFQEDVSYVLQDDLLTVFIHIPVQPIDAGRYLELFEHVELPRLGSNNTAELMHAPESSALLAVDVGRELFIELTPDELSSCGKSGNDFFCPSVFPRLRGGETACLPALFLHHVSSMDKWCKRESVVEEEKVFRINSTAIVLWTKEARTVNIECGSQLVAQDIKGLALINAKPRCRITGDHFVFETEESHPPRLHLVMTAASVEPVVLAEREFNSSFSMPALEDDTALAAEGQELEKEVEEGQIEKASANSSVFNAIVGLSFLANLALIGLCLTAGPRCWSQRMKKEDEDSFERVKPTEVEPEPMEIDEEEPVELASPRDHVVLRLI